MKINVEFTLDQQKKDNTININNPSKMYHDESTQTDQVNVDVDDKKYYDKSTQTYPIMTLLEEI